MKTPKAVGQAYDFISEGHLAALGEYPDITSAFYNGNYTKSLEQAQRDKHNWVLEGIVFQPGNRILDIGSGWGPMLKAVKDRSGYGTGLTVSQKQYEYCRKNGLHVRLQDWKESGPQDFGLFDGVISIGAFEHFCSPEEFRQGKQEEIYNDFFRFCHGVLREGGRLFLQTMIQGDNFPNRDDMSAALKPTNTPERIMHVLLELSSWWPPASKKQITKIAEPYFGFIESSNGRRDYAHTFGEWYKRWDKALKSLRVKASFAKLRLTNKDFREIYGLMQEQLQGRYFQRAFANSFLEHERMFFGKKPS